MVQSFLRTSGLSVPQFAGKATVTPMTIYNLINGGVPTTATLAKLRKIDGLGGLLPEHFTNRAGK